MKDAELLMEASGENSHRLVGLWPFADLRTEDVAGITEHAHHGEKPRKALPLLFYGLSAHDIPERLRCALVPAICPIKNKTENIQLAYNLAIYGRKIGDCEKRLHKV